jgi:hypothetical protein
VVGFVLCCSLCCVVVGIRLRCKVCWVQVPHNTCYAPCSEWKSRGTCAPEDGHIDSPNM